MVTGKEKFALWITPEAKKEVEAHYKQDNCKSQSEYIEKAIRFYSGYLDAERADEYLPRVLSDILEGKLGALGKRMGHLIFKLAVEENLMGAVLAAALEVSPDDLRKARVQSIREVKETHGEVGFEDALLRQKEADGCRD